MLDRIGFVEASGNGFFTVERRLLGCSSLLRKWVLPALDSLLGVYEMTAKPKVKGERVEEILWATGRLSA